MTLLRSSRSSAVPVALGTGRLPKLAAVGVSFRSCLHMGMSLGKLQSSRLRVTACSGMDTEPRGSMLAVRSTHWRRTIRTVRLQECLLSDPWLHSALRFLCSLVTASWLSDSASCQQRHRLDVANRQIAVEASGWPRNASS